MTARPALDPTTKLCITRHGETDWNVAGVLQGWLDIPLNANGRAQSQDLVELLSGWGFEAICGSPLRRCAETAEIIARAWGLPAPWLHPGLKERHFGLIQGMPKSELGRSHPGLHAEIRRRNPAAHFEGGESLDHFADRVLDGLHEIAQALGGKRVLIITHGWVMDVITRQVRGLPRALILDMKRSNGESLWLSVEPHSALAERGTGWTPLAT